MARRIIALYHLDAQPVVTPQVKLDVNFGNIIQLIGYDVDHASAELRQRESIRMRLSLSTGAC